MKIKNLLVVITFIIISASSATAQFADFLNYPVTVTPHESKDSTRGHFWGYMFGSYYTKVHADSGKAGNTQYSQLPNGANAFSMERVYLGYDYFYNSQFSAHVVMAHEETQDASFGSVTANQNFNRIFYLKYANVEWNNIFKGSRLSVGAITTPSFAITEEPFWGYRSVDRTIMDMKGITSSNDFGVSLGGKLWTSKDDQGSEKACVGYNVMVGNSTGSIPINSGITADYTIWKKYYGDLYVKLLNDKLVLDLYGDGHSYQWTPYHVYELTGRVFLGYKTKNFNIGVEYFEQIEKNFIYVPSAALSPGSPIPIGGDTVQDNVQSGYSIMGAVVLQRDKNTGAPKLSLFARYDFFNPNVGFNSTYPYSQQTINGFQYFVANNITESYFVAGLDFQPIKQIHFMPNIWYDGIANRDNIVPLTPREKFDYDMVLRVTFYYQFFKN